MHSLVWEEAQIIAGIDPDFHRRDLADAIEAGAFPQWELGIQVFPDTPDQMFEGIDLLDPTKIVPEELAPVQPIGAADPERQPDQLLRRDRAGGLPPRAPRARVSTSPTTRCCRAACSPTSTPSSPGSGARTSASCRSTGRTRRSTTCSATACTRPPIHAGVAPYRPNSLDGGVPVHGRRRRWAATSRCRGPSEGVQAAYGAGVVRRPLQPGPHVLPQPQPRWSATTWSMPSPSSWASATSRRSRQRELQVLANIDADLTAAVADGLGLPAPAATVTPADVEPSPALSQIGRPWPTDRPDHRDHRRRDEQPGRGRPTSRTRSSRPGCRRW